MMMRNQLIQNVPNKIRKNIKIATLSLSLLFSACEHSAPVENTKDKERMAYEDSAKTYESIALKARKEENNTISLPNYFKALHYHKLLGNKKKEEIISKNIATVYYQQGNYEKFLEYMNQALKIAKEINYQYGIRYANLALGNYEYDINNNPESALTRYFIPGRETIGNISNEEDREEMKMKYANAMANCYMKKGAYQEAEIYRNQAIELNMKIKDTITDINIGYNKGLLAKKQKRYPEAEKYLLKGLQLSQQKKLNIIIQEHVLLLAELYTEIGDRKQAYAYKEKAAVINEQIINETAAKTQQEMETKLQTKEKEIEIVNQKAKIEKQMENQKRTITISIIIALAISSIAAIYRNQKNKIARKNKEIEELNDNLWWKNTEIKITNEELERKKKEIEAKNEDLASKNRLIDKQKRNIESSIKAAKTIQDGIHRNEEKIRKLFPESFIMYQPKSVVSGDFYRFKEIEGEKLFAAVDCTGHGVSGAFISFIGNNILNNAVKDGVKDPGEMLNYLSQNFRSAMNKHAETKEMTESMDIALCSYNEKNQTLKYAGVHNPLYIKDPDKNEFDVYKGEKANIGIGGIQGLGEGYATHEIPVKKGSIAYVFSDGFADQFGGPNNKKMKSGAFKELLEKVSSLPILQQQKELKEYFDGRKGEGEQIDDVLIMGIKV